MNMEIKLVDVLNCMRELFEKDYAANMGDDGFPIDWRKARLIDSCVDIINSLEP